MCVCRKTAEELQKIITVIVAKGLVNAMEADGFTLITRRRSRKPVKNPDRSKRTIRSQVSKKQRVVTPKVGFLAWENSHALVESKPVSSAHDGASSKKLLSKLQACMDEMRFSNFFRVCVMLESSA